MKVQIELLQMLTSKEKVRRDGDYIINLASMPIEKKGMVNEFLK
jgi:hypothetical protein